ncbi:MAG: hypothetical protein IM585_08860 [Pseudanabaena sp. M135S2SP2A07QC]|nr:hypothetical protein [Pseudanabaena sp. M176S2SP2A07QC]MCA6541554.1 hypothetical protein [Pseudanabaena sp. M037S2SP2A07QC]MCA6542206.1 hypothetical protein [Pseudanabaena sp. M074S1SP2A07QC]MCA6550364.1 hypothetical protein [Pseudanabaena sp. M152S2SP2A07QC]MCA6552104.1 hypothetical protein [Pseudanabaena sp. M135S2SP2A07QC]MCA6557274.1 hypothetical protein [Pseudanabaena sp. M114S2SP2A07QC]MCA6565562.1 hypothetical protein [Pseudanabaena sp. M151S2SP2A07QC]MCA6571218.1 hypothetical prot
MRSHNLDVFKNWSEIKTSGLCVAIANDHNFKPANRKYEHVDGARGDLYFLE